MIFPRAVLLALAGTSVWISVSGEKVWPDAKTDYLEYLLYEQTGGFSSIGIAGFVTNCFGIGNATEGESFGAEWLRNAYHDMATADVVAGTGGMDASIVYEMDRPENVGHAFPETLATFVGLASTRSSLADLFALATIFAVGACSNGTMIIPLRQGRLDAREAGPPGVPEPQEDLASHTAAFARQGFNATEMIALVACGHTIGGVHGVDFPEIAPFVDNGNPLDEHTISFDSTPHFFENRVATEFVGNTSQNPLVSGPNVTTRSDERIFNSDGGVTIGRMAASNDYFVSTCTTLLERMINTVPKEVVLSHPIDFYPVKPRFVHTEVNINGTMTFAGTVRIESGLLTSTNSQVRLHVAGQNGQICSRSTPCSVANGVLNQRGQATCVYTTCPATFSFFDFSLNIPVEQGLSSFTIEIIDGDTGASVIYDNGGNGFPVEETLQPQYELSTQSNFFTSDSNGHVFSNQQLNITVAVLNAEQFNNVTAIFYRPKNAGVLQGGWNLEPVELTLSHKVELSNYTLYTLSYTYTADAIGAHPFDLVATGPGGRISNEFIEWTNFRFVPHVE